MQLRFSRTDLRRIKPTTIVFACTVQPDSSGGLLCRQAADIGTASCGHRARPVDLALTSVVCNPSCHSQGWQPHRCGHQLASGSRAVDAPLGSRTGVVKLTYHPTMISPVRPPVCLEHSLYDRGAWHGCCVLLIYVRLRSGLLPIASSTVRRFASLSPKYSQWHEPVEIARRVRTYSPRRATFGRAAAL